MEWKGGGDPSKFLLTLTVPLLYFPQRLNARGVGPEGLISHYPPSLHTMKKPFLFASVEMFPGIPHPS